MNIILKISLFSISIAFVFMMVMYLDLQYIYLGFVYAIDGNNNSLNVRFENILQAIERFKASPIIGMGPAKSEFSTVIDSEYALTLQRYGGLGVVVFGVYIVYLLRLAKRNIETEWGISLYVFMLFSCIVMSTNNIFSGYQIMSIVILLHVACVTTYKKLDENMRNVNV